MNSPLKKIGLLQLVLSMAFIFSIKGSAIAGEPTFFFSSLANCSEAQSEITVQQGIAQELHLCVDGTGEGQGLMGAEAQVTYDSTVISISDINCNAFDTCINLSSTGTINLLGISGAAPDGTPLTHIDSLGSFTLTASEISTNALSFSVARVINSDQDVETRTGVSFSVESIEAEEVEETEEEVEEEAEEEGQEEGEEVEGETEEDNEETEQTEGENEEETNESNNQNQGGGNYENLESITLTVLNSSGTPGQEIQIISSANYFGERETENITSCFPCPTTHNNSNGTTTYEVLEGPGTISFSRVRINSDAQVNEQIRLRASYFDNLSESRIESGEVVITVREPVISRNSSSNSSSNNQEVEEVEEVEIEEEEIDVEEEVIEELEEEIEEEEEEELTLEVELEPLEGAIHNSANEDEVVKNVTETAEVASSEPLQEVADVEIPAEPDVDLCAVGFRSNVDSDQDGLSDRTECYIKTEVNVSDTDGDGCWDGDELNLFYSNPLIRGDCSIEKVSRETVVITDPEPGWTVKSFDISGITPRSSEDVSLTIFPAEHRSINPIVSDYQELVEAIPRENDEKLIERKNEIINKINKFNEFRDEAKIELKDLSQLLERVEVFMREGTVKEEEITNDFLEKLKAVHVDGIFIGTVENLKQSGVGKEIVSGFDLKTDTDLDDGLYDLVAVARFGNETIASAPVRIKLERNLEVDFPKPQSLDGIRIDENNYWHESSEFALEELSKRNFSEVKIKNNRPILFGQTVYGAQIFATWESLALASSIIADSSEGNFSIQAPRELDPTENHQVTFYAVTQQDGKKIRSDNVIIAFSIEEEVSYTNYIVISSVGASLMTLSIITGIIIKRKKRSKKTQKKEGNQKEKVSKKDSKKAEKKGKKDENLSEKTFKKKEKQKNKKTKQS